MQILVRYLDDKEEHLRNLLEYSQEMFIIDTGILRPVIHTRVNTHSNWNRSSRSFSATYNIHITWFLYLVVKFIELVWYDFIMNL